jgi:hypothetical protein
VDLGCYAESFCLSTYLGILVGVNMLLIQWYKNLALVSAFLWFGLGAITIGSIALSPISWAINLIIGLFFILIGWFLHRRASSFYHFYSTSADDTQNNQSLLRFLRLDFLAILGTCLVGSLLLIASISRVFGEGFAVFG